MFYFNELESKIIEKVAIKALTTKSLVLELKKEQLVSAEAIYKAIKKLRKRNILSLSKKNLSLHFFFLNWMTYFSEKSFKFYEEKTIYSKEINLFLNGKKRKVIFKAKNKNELDNIFIQIVFLLVKTQKNILNYYFISFSSWWFSLWGKDSLQYVDFIINKNYKPNLFVENETIFDCLIKDELEKRKILFKIINNSTLLESHVFNNFVIQTIYEEKFMDNYKNEILNSKKLTDSKKLIEYFEKNLKETEVILRKLTKNEKKFLKRI